MHDRALQLMRESVRQTREPMHHRSRSASRWVLPLLIGVTASGCQRWHLDSEVVTRPLSERHRLEIWTATGRHEVHGVRLQGDSVRAVPYWRPPSCDSCALYFPRSTIDSIRVQKVDQFRTGVALVAVVVELWVIIWFNQMFAGGAT